MKKEKNELLIFFVNITACQQCCRMLKNSLLLQKTMVSKSSDFYASAKQNNKSDTKFFVLIHKKNRQS